jgi:hypothetical protein
MQMSGNSALHRAFSVDAEDQRHFALCQILLEATLAQAQAIAQEAGASAPEKESGAGAGAGAESASRPPVHPLLQPNNKGQMPLHCAAQAYVRPVVSFAACLRVHANARTLMNFFFSFLFRCSCV